MTPSLWVQEKEAAKPLAWLLHPPQMCSAGQLEPGAYWIFSTDKINSPVLYDIPANTDTLHH